MHQRMYRQAKLAKGKVVQTAWIPEKFCQTGKVVRIKDPATGLWDDGWHVVEVSRIRLDEHIVLEQTHGYHCFPSLSF